jgi:hypothetical protein
VGERRPQAPLQDATTEQVKGHHERRYRAMQKRDRRRACMREGEAREHVEGG